MRLSDILKKASKPPSTAAAATEQENKQLQHEPQPRTAVPPAEPIKTQTPTINPSPLGNSALTVSAEDIYTRLIVAARDMLSCAARGEEFKAPVELITSLSQFIDAKPNDILLLVDRATPDIYLYGHSANVCVLSMLLGKALDRQRDWMVSLGLAALMHDLGMSKYITLVSKNVKLTPSEYMQIKKHPLEGSRLVSLESTISENEKAIIAGAILQIHERKSGTGYPGALKFTDIGEYARIIAIADVYESLSHPRSYRERHIPHEAIKMLLNMTDHDFDADIMKTFVDSISLYPPGSYVRLNTDEIARVIGIIPGLPTRPRVRIVVSPENRRPDDPRVTDLSATPTIFIKDAVDETKLNLTDKKLALELKAVRWWVKGL